MRLVPGGRGSGSGLAVCNALCVLRLIFAAKYRYPRRSVGFLRAWIYDGHDCRKQGRAGSRHGWRRRRQGGYRAGPAPTDVAAHAAALAAEVTDLKDRLLRTLADMENLRRRTEREVADARSYGVTGLARDVVGAADNMRRALAAAGDVAHGFEGPAKALLDGVELTERELNKALEKHGVRRFDPQGAKFDPHLHQAMFEVPDPNVPAGLWPRWSKPAT